MGVEAGQLLFIAAVFALSALGRRVARRVGAPGPRERWIAWAEAAPAHVIGSLAAYWFLQRVAALWPSG